jgi:hypothetical protein
MFLQELLLGYWWIFLLLIIIGIVILKKTVKVIAFLLVIAVLIAVFWKLFILEGFSQANICFVEASQAQEKDYQELLGINEESKRADLFCEQDEEVFITLTSCLEEVSQEHKVGFVIYSHLPKFKDLIEDTVLTHNQFCSEKFSYPNFSN